MLDRTECAAEVNVDDVLELVFWHIVDVRISPLCSARHEDIDAAKRLIGEFHKVLDIGF